MTVQPTHQTADGRKFVKVAEIPFPVPDRLAFSTIWQCDDGTIFCGTGGSVGSGLPVTPIPQPKVRWLAVGREESASYLHTNREMARRGLIPFKVDYFVKIETLNGVRTASVEQA